MNFVVAICTARRPNMLRDCLESVLRQNLPSAGRLSVVIIENEPVSRLSTADLTNKGGITIRHRLEPRSGIPFARNAACAAAAELEPDVVALIDDDEIANPDWLTNHFSCLNRFEADVSLGPVDFNFERPPPSWWPHHAATVQHGTFLSWATTNNVAFRPRLIAETGLALRFDTTLDRGGEDIDFFQRAHSRGCKIVWCEDARVEETVPESRMQLERVLERETGIAASQVHIHAKRKGPVRTLLRFALRVLKMGPSAWLRSAVLKWTLGTQARDSARYFQARRQLALSAGYIQGLTGAKGSFYTRIDGG